MTPDQSARIHQLRSSGLGVTHIANALGLKHQTVSAFMRRTDAPRTRAPRADNGRPRKPAEQLDMFGTPSDLPKRTYTKTALEISENSELKTPSETEHLRALPAINPKHFVYCETVKKSVVPKRVIDSLVTRFSADTGLVRVSPMYAKRIFPNILANLKRGAESRCEIVVSMSKDRQTEQYINVIKWLAGVGLIHLHVQPRQYGSATDKVRSWMIASTELCQIIGAPSWVVVFDETDFIAAEVRAKKVGNEEKGKTLLTLRESSKHAACRGVIEYNKFISKACITYGAKPLACYLNRIYTMDVSHGGRWYGSEVQRMPKRDRAAIKIDGQSTTEVDYSAIHPALLAWMTGETIGGDFYANLAAECGISRDLAKSLGLRLINANSFAEFCRNVTKSGNPTVKQAALDWSRRRNETKANGEPYSKPECLHGYIEGVAQGFSGESFICAIQRLYPRIAEKLATPNIGLRLQWHDAQIMTEVLETTTEKGIEALPIHDSVITKRCNELAVKTIMLDVFTRYTNGQKITVK